MQSDTDIQYINNTPYAIVYIPSPQMSENNEKATGYERAAKMERSYLKLSLQIVTNWYISYYLERLPG